MTEIPGALPTSEGGGVDRALTGIRGIDDILAGGLPCNRLYLVEGRPGTGKTTLALQFLLEGRRLGEPGMYVTLSETADELRTSAASHGWSLDGISVIELVSEAGFGSDQEQTLLHPAEFELGEATERILERVRPGATGAARPRQPVGAAPAGADPAALPSADPRAEAPLQQPSLHRAAARRPDRRSARPAAA